jgi:hypothetical protein
MDCRLLTLPQVNWMDFIDLGKKHLGYSPTKILDDKRIPIEEPRTLLISLSHILLGKVEVHDNRVTDLIDLHFLISGSLKEIGELYCLCGFKYQFLCYDRDQGQLAICKSNISGWVLLAYIGSKHKEFEIRRVANMIYILMDRAGYTDVFAEYTKINNVDQTFELRRR